MICITIDKLTNCLEDSLGNIYPTEIVRISNPKQLKDYTSKNHWYENWQRLYTENEIYALRVIGQTTIEGLVALYPDADAKSVYITWMVAAPHNNPEFTSDKRYIGVGGHLFAIAIDQSIKYGFGGDVYGFAKDRATFEHFCSKPYYGIPLKIFHPYHFEITEEHAAEIKKEYDYEYGGRL